MTNLNFKNSLKIVNCKLKIYWLICLLAYLFTGSFPAQAQTMSNNNYILQYGRLNPAAGSSQNNSFRLESRLGENNLPSSGDKNYSLGSPKINAEAEETLSFEISELFIDFGQLSATNPVTRTNTLSVLSPFGPYKVLAYEDQELKSPSNNIIPNTTCDQGICDSETGGPWENTLTYGFGYRCDNKQGENCGSDFKTSYFYKQFPKKENGGKIIMKGTRDSKIKESLITYKINISATQPQETYSTVVHYILVPEY